MEGDVPWPTPTVPKSPMTWPMPSNCSAHEMYQEILRASLDHAGHDSLDVPAFLKRLNGALVGFKGYDRRIAGLLDRYQA